MTKSHPYLLKGKFVAVLICCFWFFSCGKIKNLVKIDVPVTMDINFTIPIVVDTGYADFGQYNIAVDVAKMIQEANENVDADHIESARFQSCTITVNKENQNAQDNLQAFSTIHTTFHSDTKPQWVAVTTMTAPPSDPYWLNMPINTDLELKDYVHDKIFTYGVAGTAARTTSREIRCKATITFLVKAVLK